MTTVQFIAMVVLVVCGMFAGLLAMFSLITAACDLYVYRNLSTESFKAAKLTAAMWALLAVSAVVCNYLGVYST